MKRFIVGLMLSVGLTLVTTPAALGQVGGYETNKFDLKRGVEAGGWVVAWSDDISETDVAEGVVAGGVSVFAENPGPFLEWVNNLVERTINSLEQDAQNQFPAAIRAEVQGLAADVIKAAISGKDARQVFRQYDTVDFKAGAIRYSGRNWIPNPFTGEKITVSRTWGMKPYVAFRWRSSTNPGPGPGPGPGPEPGAKQYFIRNAQTGLYIDLPMMEGRPNGAPVRGWRLNRQANQVWIMEVVHGNRVRFKNAWSKQYLDNQLLNGNPDDSAIWGWEFNGQDNQVWVMERLEDGNCRFRNLLTGKYIDMTLYDGYPDGSKIHGWSLNNQLNQLWRLENAR